MVGALRPLDDDLVRHGSLRRNAATITLRAPSGATSQATAAFPSASVAATGWAIGSSAPPTSRIAPANEATSAAGSTGPAPAVRGPVRAWNTPAAPGFPVNHVTWTWPWPSTPRAGPEWGHAG